MNGCAAPQGANSFHMELLMEKLRTKTSPFKTLQETSKAVRMSMLDKRWALDSSDRAILQKCLDSLQHRIKVTSQQSLVERLECLSRQLGLKFSMGTSGMDPNLFISSEMFYLEIILEPEGTVKDVKIQHEGKSEQQSCSELVSCITRGDFADFTAQLEGLMAVYQLNAQKNVKCNAFTALTALETDLGTMSQLQSCLKDCWGQVHNSPIGLVHKRRGGHALRLTYFVSPYEIAKLPGGLLTTESLAKGAGLSTLLLLENSTAHRLQLTPLVSLPQRIQSNNGPVYAALSPTNSATLPARFMLKLSQPMPVCSTLLKIMMSASESEGNSVSPSSNPQIGTNMQPILGLIVRHVSPDTNPSKGLFVTLPDQSQCYFLTETKGLEGCTIESIPFTHPRQVPALIACLRQQALFNTIISNCIRPNSKQDIESSIMVEVNALSCQHITVSLEQPGESGMATIEIELPEGGASPLVSIQGDFLNSDIYEDYLTRVLQRTMSIPLTVRALLMRWERETRSGFSGGAGGIDADGPPTSPRPHFTSHSNQSNFSNESHHNIQLFNNQDSISSIMGNNSNFNVQTAAHQSAHRASSHEEKKSAKRRKSDYSSGSPSKKSKSQMVCEVFVESGSSESGSDSDSNMEEDNVQSDSSNDEEEEPQPSPVSQTDFASDLEISGLDSAELIGGSSNDNKTSCSEFENSGDGEINDLQEMDELIRTTSSVTYDTKKHKQKSKEYRDHRSSKISNSSLLMDLEGGGYMPPSVSITPITSSTPPTSSPLTSPNFTSALTGMGLEKRPGIEIIPISSSQPTSLSSSLTIIPLPSQSKSADDRHRSDRKSSSNKQSRTGSGDRSKDKKKKRRRDDSMGPPEKLPLKPDPLTKPVSVTIKPTDRSHSPVSMRSSSPNTLMRKFSPSPTHGRSVSITKSSSSGSPSYNKNIGKSSGSSSHHSSPRHSPVQCSPKHTLSGYSSPKNHGISSPKHNSTSGSSGKPSMSTLKSAANSSPSGKSGSGSYEITKISKSSSKDGSLSITSSGSKEKERKSSGASYSTGSSGSSSPKLKSSSVKLKQLDLSVSMNEAQTLSSSNETVITPVVDLGKVSTANQVRNRKGSLSAVIDKLKSAQYCGSDADTSGKSLPSSSNKDRANSSSVKLSESKSNPTGISKAGDIGKTQEYMVKPSSDGMKITINKTRTKDSSSSGGKSSGFTSSSMSSSNSGTSFKQSTNIHSPSGTGSPKTHTGLKPGVISGPASKKPLALQSSKSSSSLNSSTSGTSQTGSTSSKSNQSNSSGGKSFSKSSSSSSLSSPVSQKSSKLFSGSPKMSSSASDLSKMNRDREKSRSSKSGLSSSSSSEKSIFASSKSNEKRLSPAPMRDETDSDKSFKVQSQHGKEQNFTVEGLIKSLDTSKYQIPKLSARLSGEDANKAKNLQASDKLSSSSSQSDMSQSRSVGGDVTAKMLDFMGRDLLSSSKYSFQQLSNSKMSDSIQKSQSSLMPAASKSSMNFSSISPKLSNSISLLPVSKSAESSDTSAFGYGSILKSVDSSKEMKIADSRSNPNMSPITSREDSMPKPDYSKTFPIISVSCAESLSQPGKMIDVAKSFGVPQKPSGEDLSRKSHVDSQSSTAKPMNDPGDTLLDFSSSSGMKSSDMKNKISSMADRALNLGSGSGNVRRRTPPLGGMSQAPSLSVHIVKSPAPSPLLMMSPHSNSPCITDDELMDEAVVGPGK